MKIGICTSPDNGAIACDAGAEYIEAGVQRLLKPLDDAAAFEESLREVDACPLPILAANGFLPGELRSTGRDFAPDRIADYTAVACARAKRVGIRHIVFGSGGSRQLEDNFPLDEAADQFGSLLKRLGPIAGEQGVVLVIEPLRRQECNFINTIAEGAAVVEAAGQPGIKLLADFYHMLQNEESPGDVGRFGSLIRHCHAAEKANRTPPGIDGEDFRPFLQGLKDSGYAGDVSLECRYPNSLEQDSPRGIATLREVATHYVQTAWWGLIEPRRRGARPLMVLQGVITREGPGGVEVLLAVRSDLRGWELPGGTLEPGEAFEEAMAREAREETGLEVRVAAHVGDYVRTGFRPHTARVYRCEVVAGDLRPSDETPLLRWFPLDRVPDTLFPWYRVPLHDALSGPTAPLERHDFQGVGAILAAMRIDLAMRLSNDRAGLREPEGDGRGAPPEGAPRRRGQR